MAESALVARNARLGEELARKKRCYDRTSRILFFLFAADCCVFERSHKITGNED